MNRLANHIRTEKMTIIVSLPVQNAEMAKIAQAAGADALKTHLNLSHRASGFHFGTFEQEKNALSEIIGSTSIPVGLVPGAENGVEEGVLENAGKMGFDFIDMYAHYFQASFLSLDGFTKMTACDHTYSIEEAIELSKLADILELSFIKREDYGKPLMLADLAKYARWMKALPGVNVVIPSQKGLIPKDLKRLYDIGVRCVMLGVVALGGTVELLEKNLTDFRNEAAKL